MVPFVWEGGWPVVNPGKGFVELKLPRPSLPEHRWPSQPVCDHFDTEQLALPWNFIRTPRGDFWSLTERPGHLRLKLKPETMADVANPSFVGRRQQHMSFAVRTSVEFAPQGGNETAGLALLENIDFQYRVEFTRNERDYVVRLIERRAGDERTLAEHVVQAADQAAVKLYLKVEAVGQDYSFYFARKPEEWEPFFEHADGTILSVDVAGGFTGTYMGLFASSNGKASDSYADFDYFEYVPMA